MSGSFGGGSGSSGGSAAIKDRELVVVRYICRTAFTGASVGDAITLTQVLDVSNGPVTVTSIWRNQTTATDLAGPPSAANLDDGISDAQTDAQFIANFGATTDAASATDAGTASGISLWKRMNQRLTTLIGAIPALIGGSLPVVQPNTVVAPVNVSALNAVVGISTGPQGTLGIQVTGNGVGFSLQPQASMDGGATWLAVGVMQVGAGAVSTPVTAIAANGNWAFAPGEYSAFQLKTLVAASSGTVSAGIVSTFASKFIRSAAIGDQSDSRTTWYDVAGSLMSRVALLIAANVDAGSHVYGYTNGQLTSDAWTLFGITRTKTFTYTNGILTAESDWV